MRLDPLAARKVLVNRASALTEPAAGVSRRDLLIALTALGGSSLVQANNPPHAVPPEAALTLGEGGRLLGSARLRMLGFRIYDARLWVAPGFDAARFESTSLALDLAYLRTLKGEDIAQRSLEEMRRGGEIAEADSRRWLAFMSKAFPDVKAGDRLCGVWNAAEGRSLFFMNGAPRPTLQDRAFGQRFFGIWLAEHSSQPEMRLALLGRGTS